MSAAALAALDVLARWEERLDAALGLAAPGPAEPAESAAR